MIKKIVLSILFPVLVFSFCACASSEEEKIPVVTCNDNGVFVNGKEVTTADGSVNVKRIDSRAVSIIVGSIFLEDGSSGIINVDSEGNEIKLSDVITDRDLYESTARDILSNDITISARSSVDVGPEVD